MDKNADVQLALEEMRMLMDRQSQAWDALDQKAGILLGASSLILPLLGSFRPLDAKVMEAPWWAWLMIVAAAGLYVGMAVSFVMVVAPRPFTTALAPDRQKISDEILGRDERERLMALVNGYIERMADHDKIIQDKARKLRCGMILLILMVLVSVAFAVVG